MEKEEIIKILEDNRVNIDKGNWDAVYDSIDSWKRPQFSDFLIENGIDPSTMFKNEIPVCAFKNCTSLSSITIPNSVTSIGDYAFYYCSSLTSITIPDSVTSIGEGAFCDCSSLTSIFIPDSVTSIGEGAFSHCSSLSSITIHNSVTFIGYGAFKDCTSLTEINYDGTAEEWSKVQLGKDIFKGTPLMQKKLNKRITFLK